jgi:hypothetical protein
LIFEDGQIRGNFLINKGLVIQVTKQIIKAANYPKMTYLRKHYLNTGLIAPGDPLHECVLDIPYPLK